MDKKLIVFEGTDLSGKTTIAKEMAKRFDFAFEHEPTFSSTYADEINFKGLNAYQREFYFMIDRINHQETLRQKDTILDRYRLTGIAYAKVFGSEALEMARSIYGLQDFKKPNLTIFVDMHPENAMKLNELRKDTEDYNPKLTIEKLQQLRQSYYHEMMFAQTNWDENIIVYEPIFGNLESTFNQVYDLIYRELN